MFDQFISQAWQDHASNPAGVAQRLEEGLHLISTADHISAMARLSNHIYGEHLGRWTDGIEFIRRLEQRLLESGPELSSSGGVKASLLRLATTLELASGREAGLAKLTLSEQIQALAGAASALASHQGQVERAATLFERSLILASSGIDDRDPAHRAIAISGNNLASSLEEKSELMPRETELMLMAAKAARKHWELAGTWLEVERAEYRLAKSHLRAGLLDQAREHALSALKLIEQNSSPALEMFYGCEALVLIERACGDAQAASVARKRAFEFFAKMSSEDQKWAAETLEQL